MIHYSYVVSSLGGPSMNMYSMDGIGLGSWEWVVVSEVIVSEVIVVVVVVVVVFVKSNKIIVVGYFYPASPLFPECRCEFFNFNSFSQ